MRVIKDKRQRPLRDVRISVTDRCNFRCGYCMPKDAFKNHQFLKSSALLSYEDIERLIRVFSGLGVTKVRLTGGEPLLRPDLENLIERLARVDGIEDVALTTNASLLSLDRAKSLKDAGVRRINISFDAITQEIYQQINEINYPMQDVLDGIANAIAADFEVVKINMVVQKGVNESDILPMVNHFKGSGAVLRFIEFMDVGNHNQWNKDKVFSSQEIVDTIHSRYPLQPVGENYPGEVAKRWQFLDGQGEIGVISSITQPFCGDCSRARISAIGELYTCLFARSGYDLKPLLSQPDDGPLATRLGEIWGNRTDQYSMERFRLPVSDPLPRTSQKVEMSYIGG